MSAEITPAKPAKAAKPASKNLHQRMAAVMQDVRRLQKDKNVGEGNYSYKAISEEKVATTLRQAFIDHGLVIFPVSQVHTMHDFNRTGKYGATVVSMSTVDVRYKLVNIDNPEEFEIIASSGTGVDPQDKGVGKAMTYAMKYALMRTFLIPTGSDPDDVHNDELARQQEGIMGKPNAATPAPAPAPFTIRTEEAADQTPLVLYATAGQKEEIIRLLNNPTVTRPEKTKVLLNINRLDEERAALAIANLKKAIADRENNPSNED